MNGSLGCFTLGTVAVHRIVEEGEERRIENHSLQ